MRKASNLLLPLLFGAGLVAVACSDDPASTSAGPDAAVTDAAAGDGGGPSVTPGSDAGPVETAPDSGSDGGGAGACVLSTKTNDQVDFPVRELTTSVSSSTFITGIGVEALPCGAVAPGEEPSGYLHPAHPGVPFIYRLSKSGYLPTLLEQLSVALGTGGTGPQKKAVLVASGSASAAFPGYDATKANLLLRVEANSGGCAAGGWTVAITGHPEAQITYWTAVPSSTMTAPTGTQTPASTTTFYVSASKIAPAAAAPIAFTLSGATCALSLPASVGVVGITGKVAFEAGAVTFVEAVGN